MSVLSREIELMQNSALGAVLLWRFTKAHAEANSLKTGPALPLTFLVLPLLWHSGTAEQLTCTRTSSGLRLFAGKFNDRNGTHDVLLAVQDRAIRWREKTAASLRVAYSTGLIALADNGCLQPRFIGPEPDQNRTVAAMVDSADKLGVWFSSLSLDEISLILHVRF